MKIPECLKEWFPEQFSHITIDEEWFQIVDQAYADAKKERRAGNAHSARRKRLSGLGQIPKAKAKAVGE